MFVNFVLQYTRSSANVASIERPIEICKITNSQHYNTSVEQFLKAETKSKLLEHDAKFSKPYTTSAIRQSSFSVLTRRINHLLQ